MPNTKANIAICYDFDGTLAPGNMQERTFIPKLKMEKKEFWDMINDFAKERDMDELLSYMLHTITLAKERNVSISREDMIGYGKDIQFFKGVPEWFERITAFGKSFNVDIEHFIISSGLREMIEGTSIAHNFRHIFASGFIYDENNEALWPGTAVNYTNKTQYLFRINKGIINSYENKDMNRHIPSDERVVPFSNMIYIGDGETDVPCMKLIKSQNGYAIAVYEEGKGPEDGKPAPKTTATELVTLNRADYMAATDYSEGAKLDKIVKGIIEKIAVETDLKSLKG